MNTVKSVVYCTVAIMCHLKGPVHHFLFITMQMEVRWTFLVHKIFLELNQNQNSVTEEKPGSSAVVQVYWKHLHPKLIWRTIFLRWNPHSNHYSLKHNVHPVWGGFQHSLNVLWTFPLWHEGENTFHHWIKFSFEKVWLQTKWGVFIYSMSSFSCLYPLLSVSGPVNPPHPSYFSACLTFPHLPPRSLCGAGDTVQGSLSKELTFEVTAWVIWRQTSCNRSGDCLPVNVTTVNMCHRHRENTSSLPTYSSTHLANLKWIAACQELLMA